MMKILPLISLSLVLHSTRGVLAVQCWQGQMFSEMVVSPELRSSSILWVPEVLSLTQCFEACCNLPGCDLAWFFNRRCYILSCQNKENCQPKKRPGTDSLIAFVERRHPQSSVLQSLVRGKPYPSHWRTLLRHRGLEDPLKDLALLEGIQSLDKNALEYDESFRALEDDITGETPDLELKPEESPELFQLPIQERNGFNFSETKERRQNSDMESVKGSQVLQSNPPAGTDKKRTTGSTSPTYPSWSPSQSAIVLHTVNDKEGQLTTSLTSFDPTPLPQRVNSDPNKMNLDYSVLPSETNLRITTQSTSAQPVQALVVSIGNFDEVILPENSVELTASVSQETETGNPYTYDWSIVSAPDGQQKVLEGKNRSTVKISKLSAGVYTVKVGVSGKHAYGEDVVNFTVRPELHLKMPPESIALPKHQDVFLSPGTMVYINGSTSSDNTGIVGYLWEQIEGPVWKSEGALNTPVLTLKNLSPGEYTFKLTVTNSEGLSDSSTATVTISNPKDEPPVANAGTDQVIMLPLNHLTLWANQSTDDHSIISYLWNLHPSNSSKGATIQGSTSPALQLSDLQEGQYTFQLTVTDSSGQQDSDSVMVTVLTENRAPVAVAGPDTDLFLPISSIILNGSSSTDDQAITSYKWKILSGPPGTEIKDGNMAVAVVTGLQAGRYSFKLSVKDKQGASDNAVITVTIRDADNLPFTAHASGSHILTLPNNSLVLRGSVSNFGSNNVSFLWIRDEQSPAAGDILFSSEHEASLYLANLVEGTYRFQLRVTDSLGHSSTAAATVEVRPDVHEREVVELELQVPVAQVSKQQKQSVVRQLAAMLHVQDADIIIKGLHGQSDISTVLRFLVWGPDGTIPGTKLSRLLRYQLLKEKTDYLLFRVLRVDTVTCLLHCSGRGQCDPITRRCSCDSMWMENPFRRFLDDESNCDWSVLYVTICCIVVIIFLVSTSWAWCKRPTCVCQICCFGTFRGRRSKIKKKTKYTMLDNMDEQERMELRPKYSIKHRSTEHNSSLMMSESEFDSDQDTIFSNERTDRARHRVNGVMANGDTYGLRPVEG